MSKEPKRRHVYLRERMERAGRWVDLFDWLQLALAGMRFVGAMLLALVK
ncbi:hypothetical protein SAZ10_19190 [Mesorhizobium sp. BAC0120]|nr:hypothetical protein [Mesorhizobium sp. BAC0120]MDW6023876.1 hypothetical protein [Mesorhizobium sp. BAC0120]